MGKGVNLGTSPSLEWEVTGFKNFGAHCIYPGGGKRKNLGGRNIFKSGGENAYLKGGNFSLAREKIGGSLLRVCTNGRATTLESAL